MCPDTYGWAEALILWRDNQATNRPLVINLNTLDTLISAGDLDFDMGWGVRAGFGVRTCDRWAWEFGYFSVFDQNADESPHCADELYVPTIVQAQAIHPVREIDGGTHLAIGAAPQEFGRQPQARP